MTERLIVTLSADMAAEMEGAVAAGDYVSTSELVQEALRDWRAKRAISLDAFAALKGDIDKGLADIAADRVWNVDTARIVDRGRRLFAARSSSD